MANSLFEATLIGCKNLDKPNAKKATKAKSLSEARKAAKRRRITESEDDDKDLPDDMLDDAIVVVDPDLEVEEIADNLDNLQSILDATADGEVATSDEYIGNDIYACPICGNNFFSDSPMEDGDTCPVCGETPDGYVLVGEVSEPEATESDEDTDDNEDDDEVTDIDDPKDDTEEIEDNESLDLADVEDEIKEATAVPASLQFEDKRFNTMLTKYVTENYKNAKSMTVKNVILRGNTLVCECVILFKSGKKSRTNLQFEGFTLGKKQLRLRGTEVGHSICTESKFPFMLEAKMLRNNIIPVTFRYNYNIVKENKTYRVYGKTLAE